eukprot:496062-Pyramimonas_sp.AAC.1
MIPYLKFLCVGPGAVDRGAVAHLPHEPVPQAGQQGGQVARQVRKEQARGGQLSLQPELSLAQNQKGALHEENGGGVRWGSARPLSP